MASQGNAVTAGGPGEAGQVVQMWPLSRFRPYDRNPRKNDHAVERVAAAIKEFGFKVPVLARSSGELVDGHLRLKAASFLGLASIPVLLADDLTDAQVRAFRISVNRMAELAEWDTELLAAEQLGRRCYGLELDPGYCDVIVRRWEGVTDKQATLESTGETFAAVAAKRAQAT